MPSAYVLSLAKLHSKKRRPFFLNIRRKSVIHQHLVSMKRSTPSFQPKEMVLPNISDQLIDPAKIGSGNDRFHVNSIVTCSKSHACQTALFMQYPQKWCPHPDCDGISRSVDLVLANAEISKSNVHRFYFSNFCAGKREEVLLIKCRFGHEWVVNSQDLLRGNWCNECLMGNISTDSDKLALARMFGIRFSTKKSSYYCYMGDFLTNETSDIIRGLRCFDHFECINRHDKNLTHPGEETIVSSQSLSDPAKIEEIKKMDWRKELKSFDIEAIVTRFSDIPLGLLYLKAKYCDLQKVKELARSKGGYCISEEFDYLSSRNLIWVCERGNHSTGYTWSDCLDSILKGSWCEKCKAIEDNIESEEEVIAKKPKKSKKSRGHTAVCQYLVSRGIPFVEDTPMGDCRYIKPLRFDFILPTHNAAIEYDGAQHFKAIDFFGGIKAYQDSNTRDNVKAIHCFTNRIRLGRFWNLKTLEQDLDAFFQKMENVVTFIPIDPAHATPNHFYVRQTAERYVYQYF